MYQVVFISFPPEQGYEEAGHIKFYGMFCNDPQQIQSDWDNLPGSPVDASYFTTSLHNVNFNRHAVFAIESTLVKLPQNQYINANTVNIFSHLTSIATQAPLPNTFDNFFIMIIFYKVKIVIMLTRTEENGILKADEYWNVETNEFIVTLLDEQQAGAVVYRKIFLKNKLKCEEYAFEHIQFLGWPDQGVPDTTDIIIQIAEKVLAQTNVPHIVHCSAGIGRTGAFIGFLNFIYGISIGINLPIFEIVSRMRHQRAGIIQTQSQYEFIHSLAERFIHLQALNFLARFCILGSLPEFSATKIANMTPFTSRM